VAPGTTGSQRHPSGDAKAEEIMPGGQPHPMPPMKTFRNGDIY
jgi:hypothetical protein